MSGRYERLIAWQKAHDLAIEVYKLTATFPTHELYGLTSQLRRAATSVPANIAEGYSRISRVEFRQFLSVARGSVNEVDYFLLLARDLSYLTDPVSCSMRSRCQEIMKLVTGLMNSVERRPVLSSNT